ncbi:hypothetical protein ABN764_20600 [Paenibacillaceae sp. P-4]|uniref:hypothetical protein n=1 Tax=Paenibacillaceae bacterium P-4 TaxID=3160969 RepID=UPI0032E84846
MRWLDPSGHIKDSFGATLSMPKDADEAAKLISQAKNNWAYAQQQISAIKSGKGTGMLCKGCNSVDTWKSYQNSMHSWAERIRKTQFVGISAYIKAEAGASLAIGGKLGAEIKDDKIKLYYISTYGQGGANISLTGGFSQTNDSTGKMNSWTGNAGASYGAFFLGEASLKSDMKYLEFSVGGGIGAAAEIYLLPISGEKEYSATWDLPFNLGKKGAISPSYVGAPSAQEWLDMIGGKGW